jgi:hypothetical protein
MADDLPQLRFPHTEHAGGYHQITAMDGKYEVAWLRWKNDDASEYHEAGEITALGVAAVYQHRGVAIRMYREALTYSPVLHSQSRTPDGDGFAAKAGGPAMPLRPEGLMAPMDPPPVRYVG